MSPRCPWCQAELEAKKLRGMGGISEPCRACGKPLRISLWQLLFTVLLLMPLIAGLFYLSNTLYEKGHTLVALVVFFTGLAAGMYIQKFIPVIHGPARGFSKKS